MKFAYQNNKSLIHKLHPICKIIWTFAIIIGCFLIEDPLLLLILFLSTIPFVIAGKIIRGWIFFIKFALILSIIIVIINIFASQHGYHIIYQIDNVPLFNQIKITLESFIFSLSMALRLLSTISAFSIITLTISPDELLYTILRLKIPYKTVFTTSIAIRFIPTLINDLNKLQDSLKSRAYKINEGGFFSKIKRRAILIPPLLSNSLERSIQSAEAMESRGFGSKGKKTYYKPIHTTKIDFFFILLPISMLFFLFVIWISKNVSFQYFPNISKISLNFTYFLVAILLIIFSVSPILFSPLKKVIDFD